MLGHQRVLWHFKRIDMQRKAHIGIGGEQVQPLHPGVIDKGAVFPLGRFQHEKGNAVFFPQR